MMFPRSRVKQFYKDNPTWREQGKRLGQAFYEYMNLYSATEDREEATFLSVLYHAPSHEASRLIIQHTDWSA